MKTSILIIAHNEEKYIAKCIESILSQTKRAEEIVLIAHNCTDQTEAIARTYPITVVPFSGPLGITYARIEGLNHTTGDIILCIDGDSFAAKNWIEVMSELLQKGKVLVGSWDKMKGSFHAAISNIFNYFWCNRKGKGAIRWIWGPSMAFWEKDKEKVKDIFKEFFSISKILELSQNPDDLWLALCMSTRGILECTNKTCVTTEAKERSTIASIKRNFENLRNGKKMEKYFFRTTVR